MKRLLVVAAAASFACGGSKSSPALVDPCIALVGNLTVTGTRFSDAVELTWTGSPAGGFEVWAFGPAHEDTFHNPVTRVSDTTATVGLPASFGTVQLEVRPGEVGGVGSCATTALALTVPVAPVLTAAATASGVNLSWSADPLYTAEAVVGRGLDVNHIFVLAQTLDAAYFDNSATGGTTYQYVVSLTTKNLVGFSAPAPVATFPAAPVVTTGSIVGNVLLKWTSAATICVVDTVPPSTRVEADFGAAALPCPAETDCSFQIQCRDEKNRDAPPVIATGRSAPPPPTSCSATSLVGSVQLAWTAPATPPFGYLVERSVGSSAPESLGPVSGLGLADSASPILEIGQYSIFSVDSHGAVDRSKSCSASGMRTNAPDTMNLGPITGSLSGSINAGQSFTVSSGGQLMGIELPGRGPQCIDVISSGDNQLPVSAQCSEGGLNGAGGPLVPDSLVGTYLDVSSLRLMVSAGETIAFDTHVVGDDLPTTADQIAGTATISGGATVPSQDLVFKAFVRPVSGLPKPLIDSHVFGSTALLTWTASPEATMYVVFDTNGTVLTQTNDTFAAVTIDPALGYAVKALGPNGTSAVSSTLRPRSGPTVPLAENLCPDAPSGERQVGESGISQKIEQTFTVTRSGKLATIEAEIAGDGFLSGVGVQVEDAAGNLLALFSLESDQFTAAFPPISPYVALSNVVDVSARAVQVNAGDTLRLVIGPVIPLAFSFGLSGDEYAGGALTGPGVSSPADLCFRVTVTPD